METNSRLATKEEIKIIDEIIGDEEDGKVRNNKF